MCLRFTRAMGNLLGSDDIVFFLEFVWTVQSVGAFQKLFMQGYFISGLK